jgi:RimJ/RimL family protein N-acetyltransferase
MLSAVVKLCQDKIVLSLIEAKDLEFYQSIYTDTDLMAYIKFFQDPVDIAKYFYQQCHQEDVINVTEFNYVINLKHEKIGLVGLKLDKHNSVEMGVIIKTDFQGAAWSYRIKKSLLKYLLVARKSQQVTASCDVRNAPANHINKKLGMKLLKVIDDHKHNRQINHWVMDKNNDSEHTSIFKK